MPIDFVPQLVSAGIRALGLGLLAVIGLWLFRVRSSAARHATWTAVLAGMLLQIPLGMIAPTISFTALPFLTGPGHLRLLEPVRISVPAVKPSERESVSTGSKAQPAPPVGMFTCVYLAVSVLLFGRMLLGSWGLRRILRDARPIASLGSGVFESGAFVVPGSVGCFRARILLPRSWREWDAIELRAVLAHERAHVRRRDWLVRVVSHVNVCVFWFHPLAWWMDRELARLAEEASDDCALAEVDDREDYAATLVHIAHAAASGGGVLNWRVIPMAANSNVIRRVNRILNRGFQIPKPFGRLARVTLLACSLPVIYLFAAVKLASSSPQRTVSRPAEAAPITMCILLDNSGSMRDKRAGVKAAALALVNASKPNDEVCIVHFNDEAFNGLPNGKDLTSDTREMEEALARMDSRGGTAMRDAVRMAIDHVEQKGHHARKVLVLITEGDDTSSSVTQEELLGKVKSSGVRVYAIGLPTTDNTATLDLRQLADISGGVAYFPGSLADVDSFLPEIAKNVRGQ
jgi:hypothetical protein